MVTLEAVLMQVKAINEYCGDLDKLHNRVIRSAMQLEMTAEGGVATVEELNRWIIILDKHIKRYIEKVRAYAKASTTLRVNPRMVEMLLEAQTMLNTKAQQAKKPFGLRWGNKETTLSRVYRTEIEQSTQICLLVDVDAVTWVEEFDN